jgi:adenylate cyclase
MDLASLDKPSIAVLPFANMSGDPEQDYFVDGLVEDITTTLSKISGLIVIARNSSFTYKGRAVDVRQVARELGVRYVLEGGVRKSGNRIRITAQLIDAGTGAHVWAERFDRAIEDIFAVQDEITLVLATEMQVRLTEGEQARLRYATTNNIEAWSYWVQGLSHFRRGLSREGLTQALSFWRQAHALDPSSAPLNAMLGFLQYANARFGLWDDRETALRRGDAFVDNALALDPTNADAHLTRSLLLMLHRRFDEAVLAVHKAIEYGPGSADIAVFASFVFDNVGLVQKALVQIERAMKLSPIFPPNYLGQLGNAYRLAGRYDEAIAAYESYHKRSPGRGVTDLVIIYQQLGQSDKAKAWATQLLLADPTFTVNSWSDTQFIKDAGRLEGEVAALLAAGLPE